jgi:hypothetical protein
VISKRASVALFSFFFEATPTQLGDSAFLFRKSFEPGRRPLPFEKQIP